MNHAVSDAASRYYFLLLLALIIVSVSLSITMIIQIACHQIPCPLCLLQRLGLLGMGVGLISAFRRDYSPAHIGAVMVFSLYLLMVGVRQSLNNIVARPGHHWIGGTILGLHLPVWAVITAFGLLLLCAAALLVAPRSAQPFSAEKACPLIHRLGVFMSACLIMLCGMNLLMVFLQCGVGICHTYSYAFLNF